MTLVCRPARLGDLAVIVAMLADDEKAAGREDAGEPLDPGYAAAFAAIHADPNQLLIVAEADGETVGTMQLSFLAGLSFRGAWRCQIEAVRIVSARRGGGLGAAMIGWAIGEAKRRGCRMVQLTSHVHRIAAHRFYERLGFTRSHAGFKLTF